MARPRKFVDKVLLHKLAAIHCNQDEMSSILGVSTDTLQRRFAAEIKAARNEGKMSLRRKMWQMALDGNVTLLVWLSKNELGYTDKTEQKAEVNTKTETVFKAEWGNTAERPDNAEGGDSRD